MSDESAVSEVVDAEVAKSELVLHDDHPRRALAFLPSEHDTGRIWGMATTLSQTEFVPKSIRGNVPAIAAAMLTGRELGILPMRALRQINVIDGKPSPSPELMMALALKAGHQLDVAVTTRERCVVEVHRAEWPADKVRSLEWTLEDAVVAGLCSIDPETGRARARSRTGNPLPWEAYTRAMLRSRAVSEAARTWLPDVVDGASYAPEELGAHVNGQGHAVELVDTARARGEAFDPLEGESDEVRAGVAASFGDDGSEGDGEPQVDANGNAIDDAEVIEDVPAPASGPDLDAEQPVADAPDLPSSPAPDVTSEPSGPQNGSEGLSESQVANAVALIDERADQVAGWSADEVMAEVEAGALSPAMFLSIEMVGKQRTSLMARLGNLVTMDQRVKARQVADAWLAKSGGADNAGALVRDTPAGTAEFDAVREDLRERLEVAIAGLRDTLGENNREVLKAIAARAALGPWESARMDKAAELVDRLEQKLSASNA